eukprot:m51a1_g12988 putative histone h4 (127) ;mRNA; r:2158-2538
MEHRPVSCGAAQVVRRCSCGPAAVGLCLGGKGGVGAKRHRMVLRDNLQGITRGALRRLARRGGVKRIAGPVYEEARAALKKWLEALIGDAVLYTESGRRRTVTVLDVLLALKRLGSTLYGLGYTIA